MNAAAATSRRALRNLSPGQLAALLAAGLGAAGIVILSLIGGGLGGRHTPPAPAKNFSLPALGHPGQQISLAALAGQPVIVNFFASWCAPCQKETPMLARFARGTHGRIRFIGIDVNDPSTKALAFVHRKGVTYPVASASISGPTANDYGLPGLPSTFFLDARHRIVKRVYGALTQAELAAGAALIGAR